MRLLTSMCDCALPDVVKTGKDRLWMRLFPSRRLYRCCSCGSDLFLPQKLGDEAVDRNGAARFFEMTDPADRASNSRRHPTLW